MDIINASEENTTEEILHMFKNLFPSNPILVISHNDIKERIDINSRD